MSRRSSRIEENQKLMQGKPVAVAPSKVGKVAKATKSTSQRGSTSKSKCEKKRNIKLLEPEKPKSPKKRGYLEQFANQAPLDVMVEIFSYLWPREILFLSRTSKSFRKVLMSKSSNSIWRAARNNAGLPPLPRDLSESQYASLAFDPYCKACGHGLCDNIIWELRTKCHKQCFDDLLFPRSRLSSVVEDWSEDVVAMIELGMEQNFLPCYKEWHTFYFLPSTIVSFYSEYKEVKHDARSLEDWSSKKRQEYNDILKHVNLCIAWHRKKVEDRKAELADLRLQRANEIIGRLSKDGWETRDLRSLEDSHYSILYQPVEFNESTWPDTHASLTRALSSIKADRLKQQEKGAYAVRHRVLHGAFATLRKEGILCVSMPLGDIVFASAKINELLWRPLCEERENLDALKDVFQKALKNELPGLFQDWIGRVEKQLVPVLQKEIPNADVETLKLASSVFNCRRCSEPLWYPFLIGHRCFRGGATEDHHLTRKPGSVPLFVNTSNWRNFFDPFRELSWELWCMNSRSVSYSSSSTFSQRMKCMLRLCGFDSGTSIDVIVKVDPLLECSGCTSSGQVRMMGWTTAILHHDCHVSALSIVDETRPIQAFVTRTYRDAENRMIKRTRGGMRKEHFLFLCKICRGASSLERFGFMSYRTLKVHFKERHDITEEDAMNGSWELSPGSDLGLHPVNVVVAKAWIMRRCEMYT